MARHAGLSPSTVGRIWKAFRLKPHLSETFKLSIDPFAFVSNLDRSMVACGAPYVDPMRMGTLAVMVGPAQTR